MADPAGLARSANAAKARWVNTVVRYPVHFGARDSCEVRVRDWVYPSIPIPGRPGSRSRSAAAAAEGLGEDHRSLSASARSWAPKAGSGLGPSFITQDLAGNFRRVKTQYPWAYPFCERSERPSAARPGRAAQRRARPCLQHAEVSAGQFSKN